MQKFWLQTQNILLQTNILAEQHTYYLHLKTEDTSINAWLLYDLVKEIGLFFHGLHSCKIGKSHHLVVGVVQKRNK